MTQEELITYIEHPETLNKESLPELERLVKEYPYFQTASLLYLKNLKNVDDINFQYELKRTALLVPDRKRLELVINGVAKAEKKTEDKKTVENQQSVAEITLPVGNIEIPDATADANSPKLQHADLIDRFITENPHIKPVGEVSVTASENTTPEKEQVTDSIFTESLAKIYIRQKQYAKAIRIFEKLNLNYPEKSSYFADQIKNLKNLIENS